MVIPVVVVILRGCGIVPMTCAVTIEVLTGAKIAKVYFERHVMSLFGRMGCNGGSCHASFHGKGGFQLSLFGYAPDKDYLHLTRGTLARRINPADPDQSLILLKATGQVRHEGGVRFANDSWQYQVLRQWIADGAVWDKGNGEVAEVTVTPGELAFVKPGEARQLQVNVRFTNGDQTDITPFCDSTGKSP